MKERERERENGEAPALRGGVMIEYNPTIELKKARSLAYSTVGHKHEQNPSTLTGGHFTDIMTW